MGTSTAKQGCQASPRGANTIWDACSVGRTGLALIWVLGGEDMGPPCLAFAGCFGESPNVRACRGLLSAALRGNVSLLGCVKGLWDLERCCYFSQCYDRSRDVMCICFWSRLNLCESGL